MAGEAFGLRPGFYPGSGHCPDCDADTELRQDTAGVWQLFIRHDDTCPTYRAMKARTP